MPGTNRAAEKRAEKALTRLLAAVDAQRAPTSSVTLVLGGNNITAPVNACDSQVPVNLLGVQVPLNSSEIDD